MIQRNNSRVRRLVGVRRIALLASVTTAGIAVLARSRAATKMLTTSNSRHARARLHPKAMPVILTTELLAGAAGAAAAVWSQPVRWRHRGLASERRKRPPAGAAPAGSGAMILTGGIDRDNGKS